MRRFIFIVSLLLPLFVGAQNLFVPLFGDVPLSQNITIDAHSGFSLETVDGRIAQISGVIVADHKQSVIDFYTQALPSLGWQQVSGDNLLLRFIRDNEELKIDLNASSQIIFYSNPL